MKSDVVFIMSVYKHDNIKYMIEAIDSMLKQKYKTDIYIYIDGDINDNASLILDEYNKNPLITIFANNQNKGLAFALNFLIDKAIDAGYKYIARMDSDDISRPHRIEKQHLILNKDLDIDVLGTSCREFGASFALDEKHLPKTHEELINFSITRCPLIHPSVMFRTSVFKDGIRYPEHTTLTEDMALWFLLLNKGYRIANINDILLDYRLNEGTINRRKGFNKAMSEIKIRFCNMVSLKQINIKNILLISARIIFHLMPTPLVKLAYKKTR